MPRQGSQMSKYIKKRRSPGAEETWGHQGSVESLSGDDIDGPNDERFVGGQDFFFCRVRLIKGVCGYVWWLGVGGSWVVFVWGDPCSEVRFGVFFREKASGRTWWRPFVSCVFRPSPLATG